MKLNSLKLRGAIGLRPYGDEVNIDFSEFDNGVIAIIGENGSGKTTILENSHPWPELVSRRGSLSNHFHLRDSFRELRFEYNSHEYFSKILIDAKNGKMEAYLYQDNQPLNDGKIPSYRDMVNKLFGSPFVFFKSVFAGQNGEKISQLTPGTKKEFFIGLLGLDHYERLAESAKVKAIEFTTKLSGILGEISPLRDQISGNEIKIAEYDTISESIRMMQESISDGESQISKLSQIIEDAKKLEGLAADTETRITDLEGEISQFEKDISALEAERTNEIMKLSSSISDIDAECEKLKNILTNAPAIRESEKRLQNLKTECAELDSAQLKISELNLREGKLNFAIKQAEDAHNKAVDIVSGQIRDLSTKISEHFRRLTDKRANIENSIATNKSMAAGKERVPCRDMVSLVTSCPLLQNVRNAEDTISKLETELESVIGSQSERIPEQDEVVSLEETKRKLEAETYAVDESKELATIPSLIALIPYDAKRHEVIKKDIANLLKLKLPELITEIDRAEATLDEKAKSRKIFSDRENEISIKYTARIAEIKTKIEGKKADRGMLDLQLSELKSKLPPGGVAGFLKDKADIEANLSKSKISLGSEKQKLESLDTLIGENEGLKQKLQTIEINEKSVRGDLSDWKLLESAFGKNGLQALELDAAGPAISSIATEMIQAFGREWAISISTIRRSADGKKDVETFDINVSTPRGLKNFEDLSGGEQVWVEESLRKAITIYLINNSGRDYKTLFQDEADGPLDPDRAVAFLETSEMAHKLTGAHQTIIISQRPEIWRRIPQRIHLNPEEGKIEIVREG